MHVRPKSEQLITNFNFSPSRSAIIVSIIIRGSKHMEAKMCWFVLALQTLSFLVSAASRPFATNDGFAASKPGQSIQFAQAPLGSKEGIESMEGGAAGMISDEAYSRGVSKIGSSPPSCEHKCYGCTPCEAIQVPTTSKRRSRLGINYANYEPEGWKCKCGPSFYSP